MRRVVVTGLGLVTPLGADVETAWKNIVAAKSGAGTITRFDATDFQSNYACEVKPAGHAAGNPQRLVPRVPFDAAAETRQVRAAGGR